MSDRFNRRMVVAKSVIKSKIGCRSYAVLHSDLRDGTKISGKETPSIPLKMGTMELRIAASNYRRWNSRLPFKGGWVGLINHGKIIGDSFGERKTLNE